MKENRNHLECNKT